MLEKLKEFKETLSERVKSPFVGSFMITWSVIHWKIFALILYDEENLPIVKRIGEIDIYLSKQTACDLIIKPVLITFAVLIIYGILNGFGLIIKLGYDQWLSPYIQKILYNENIIEKHKYEKLKREFDNQKKDYDSDKEIYLQAQTDSRSLKSSLDDRIANSFEAKRYDDITFFLSQDQQWELFCEHPDGKTSLNTFTLNRDKLIFSNGDTVKIENIRAMPNGKILSFDKRIDDKTISAYLIRDNKGEYHGVEADGLFVSYRKKRAGITIISAKYGTDDKFNDVTERVSNLVANNLPIKSSNELSGDPIPGAKKKLEVNYKINSTGEQKQLVIPEGVSQKIVEK